MNQIKNYEEFYKSVKEYAKYTIEDLMKEDPSEYESFADYMKNVIIPYMEEVSRKQWSSELTFLTRLDASREIIRLERDLKWIRDLYENVSNQRNRICYFDSLPARSKYKIATRFKNRILSTEKVKGIYFANSGNTLYNQDYKVSNKSKDSNEKDMLILSGLDKDDAYFYELAKLMLQILIESHLSSSVIDYYNDLCTDPGEFDIPGSLISSVVNPDMKISFNGETDIILSLDGILFNGFRNTEKLSVRDKLDDLRYRIFLGGDTYNDVKDPNLQLGDDFMRKEFYRNESIGILREFDKLLRKIKDKAPSLVRDHDDYLNSVMYELP